MPAQFRYKAVAADGTRKAGTIPANSRETVAQFLQEQQLHPIEIAPIQTKRPASLFGFLKGADYEKLIMFTNALATMNRAGIPLLRALSVIRIGEKAGRFNFVIEQLRLEVQAGKPLSESMSKFPDVFSGVYVSCVAAGEESGGLDSTLDQLGQMLEREAELTRQLKSGIRYPLMVVAAILAAFFVIMQFVVPRFSSFYGAFDAELPLPTQIIITISNFTTGHWPILLGVLVAAGFGMRTLLRNEDGRLWFDRQLLRLPILGDLIIKGNVARFSLMFRILIASGLTIVRSVDILVLTVKNAAIGHEIKEMGEAFRRGQEIDFTSGAYRYFPEQALHMLSVGLESGNLEGMLREVGQHYTKQVIYTSRQLTAIIEPILTVVMGIFVLVLALAVFLPMWNLIKVFQG
jgi:type II secretory pathway component PulF